MLGQSWLAAYLKFQPMITELFRKVPDEVAQTLLRKVRDFVMAVTEPQAADALSIVAMATRRCDDDAVALLLKPLMHMVDDDARSVLGARSAWHSSAADP